jgi:hypothetical protein
VKWFDDDKDHPPFIEALEKVRLQATREGWCYHHVQAIIVLLTSTRKPQRGIGITF